jgi:uncharacterized membrane protein
MRVNVMQNKKAIVIGIIIMALAIAGFLVRN